MIDLHPGTADQNITTSDLNVKDDSIEVADQI